MDAYRAAIWAALSVVLAYLIGLGPVPIWAALSAVLCCFVGYKLTFSKQLKLRAGRYYSSESPQVSTFEKLKLEVRQVNDSLYELHRPEGTPSIQILFFHGLQLADVPDAHLCTWKSEDGTVIWPRDWLVMDFPQAHIFSVSYEDGVRNMDMFVVGENLTSDLIDGDIGQLPNCPVVLVGHCVGGLVIKKICWDLREKHCSGNISDGEKQKLGTFLDNLRGIFFYGTPHRGSAIIANVEDGPLFDYFKVLNQDAARLNAQFDGLRKLYPKWQVHGLGESQPSKLGLHERVMVPEASSRAGEVFHVVDADHNSLCQPRNRKDRRFYALKKLLDEVATEMKEEASPQNFLRLPKGMTSIDTQMHEIMGKLDEARIVGLAGMGGLGKTTLAMAMFNDLSSRFEYTCFVRNVKLIRGGEEEVKAVVWDHMHYHGKKVEGQRNWSNLKGQKLLLVLDDITYREETILLDLANDPAPESRFIVTSRDQERLRRLGEVYLLPFWNHDSAKVLFMTHAFPHLEEPPTKLNSIIESIIKKCDGLPLTLEVLGKCLERKRNHEDWKQTLTALEKAEDVRDLNERLWAKLRVSYDDLGPKEKQMFLDATTFFATGSWTLRDAQAAWRVAYETTSERLLWQTLVDMSLVYSVEENEIVKVHEQLRQLGERIALEPRNNDNYRVWNGEEGLKLLQTTNKWDGKRFHALRLGRSWKGIHIPRAALSKLKKVQFLEVNGPVIIDGAMKGVSVPTEVVLLKCHGQDLFNPGLQTRLTVLELSGLHDLPHSIGKLSTLKYLAISDCNELPNSFGQLKALQRFNLHGCGMESLPETFGQLSALSYLSFYSCRGMESLPETFGQLSALRDLSFYSCYRLRTLSESFGQLSALNHLVFDCCYALQALPESFGHLSALNHVEFDRCNELQTLPESFGQLSALNSLSFYGCGALKTLPDSFGQLSALKDLQFHCCTGLQTLPESFGRLSALDHLEFHCCNELQTLPESFGALSGLVYLSFDRCESLYKLPESFGKLVPLHHLLFYIRSGLESLPETFGQSSTLKTLRFSDCYTLVQQLATIYGNSIDEADLFGKFHGSE